MNYQELQEAKQTFRIHALEKEYKGLFKIRDESMDFYYTENEYETAKKHGENYHIYVVYEILTAHPKIWMIKNPFIKGEGINMRSVKYKVEFRTNK